MKKKTYPEKQISEMSTPELKQAIEWVRWKLATTRGHKLRDRLHAQREEIEGRLATA